MATQRRQDALSIISIVLGIAGIASAAWFYHVSRRERVLTYAVSPERTAIVGTGRSEVSDLHITYKGKPIRGKAVTSSIVYVWNRGSESIRRDNVLVPVAIQLDSDAEILDARLVRCPRERVTRFGLAPLVPGSNKVQLAWDILETGDGGVVQIVYVGRPDCNIRMTGSVEGQRTIPPTAVADPQRTMRLVRLLWMSIGLAAFAGVISLLEWALRWLGRGPLVDERTMPYLFIVGTLYAVVAVPVLRLVNRPALPGHLLP